jgi:hypothetical protein
MLDLKTDGFHDHSRNDAIRFAKRVVRNSCLLPRVFVNRQAALAIALVLVSAPVSAQSGNCDEGGSIQKCAVDMSANQGDLIDAIDGLLTELENGQVTRGILARNGEESEGRRLLDKLGAEHGRAEDALEETSDGDYEEMIIQGAKLKGRKCNKWSEASILSEDPNAKFDFVPAGVELLASPNTNRGDLGNGKCDSFFVRDLNSNKTYWIRERSQPSICVRECGDDDSDLPSGQKKKVKMRGRFVDRMTENIAETEEATLKIDELTDQVQAVNLIASRFGFAAAFSSVYPECDLSADIPDIALWAGKIVLVVAKGIVEGVALTAEALQQTTKDGCQQDVLGNNVSTACAPLTIVAYVAKGLVILTDGLIEGTDLAKDGIDIFTADATHQCVREIAEQQVMMMGIVSSTNTVAGEIQQVVGKPVTGGLSLSARLGTLETLVRANQEYIKDTRTLVLTPHGLRASVPIFEP